jgi:hypothetical protein
MAGNSILLSRRQTAALLGLTEEEVKTRDNITFHPTKGKDGSWRYQPEEVAAVLRGVAGAEPGVEPNGAVCAAAFESFRGAKSLPEVVIALKQTPGVIRRLRVEYDAMAGCLTLGPASRDRLAEILRVRPCDETHLVELVSNLLDRLQREYQRGHEDGLAEAGDLGEIVDPSTGQRRRLEQDDVEIAARRVAEHWTDGAKGSKPSAT